MSVIDSEVDYFHINRKTAWSPHNVLMAGSKIDIGGASNPYFSYFEKFKKTVPVTNSEDGSLLQVPGVKFVGAVARGDIHSDNVAGIASDILKHFVAYLRELIWEDVRAKEFPHLPSRQRCIWLIPDMEGVKFWINRIGLNGSDFQVLRVRGQGRIHTASELYLLGDSEPMEESLAKARKYWLGVVEDHATKEVIFEGRLNVQEIVSPEQYA